MKGRDKMLADKHFYSFATATPRSDRGTMGKCPTVIVLFYECIIESDKPALHTALSDL